MATSSGPMKRAASRPAASPAASNAIVLGLATAAGCWLLVTRGRMEWPPRALMADAYLMAGCLGLCGPIILARAARGEWALGDFLWMSGGTLLWLSNLALAVRGRFQLATAPQPLAATDLGLATLAILIAGARLQGSGRTWSWTNLLGWSLAFYWIGMGSASLLGFYR